MTPAEIIEAMVLDRTARSDQEILDELAAFRPLVDEDDPSWDWELAYRYVALGDVAAQRRLQPAVRLLLDRACFGDPGELMRGLRHTLEAIMNPDWAALAEICIDAACEGRRGTTLRAVDQLLVLEDQRARPLFEALIRTSREPDISSLARIALGRLDRLAPH